jgi:phenylacetate-CoA ligase
MDKISGRTDDKLIVRGINVFPSQIETVLLRVEGVQPHYQIVVDRQRTLDDLEVWVEVSDEIFTDEIGRLEGLENNLRNELHNSLGISARVKLVEPRTIQRSEGKAQRVLDRRHVYST